VSLRGEVPSAEEIQRLIDHTLAVTGVLRVENLLHTPGTPAPTGGAG
jgi:osmotically-inducible protein OsmY